MTVSQVFLIVLFFISFAFLRFGVPVLVLWAFRRLATHYTPAQPQYPITG